jgi:phenylpropionate dioxygenase-like ring-hydroxylating dioxygenase large terminal subunit
MIATSIAKTDLLPGGDDLTRFDPKEAWYPVVYLDDLDKNRPTKFTLLEIDLVIWWEEATKTWRAFEDKCPHRLAPLSEGRINDRGWLECPYHGWAFSGEGTCETIPQQPADGKAETSQRACVKSFPTTEAQGLLFVYPGDRALADRTRIPIVEPLEQSSDDWVIMNTFRDLPYDALTLLENVIDASHIPYTHHKTVGNRQNAAPVELEILESGKQGFQGKWAEGPRKGALGTQYTHFVAPGLMWHDLTSKQFGRTLTVVYATPIRKGECRLFARFPFKFASPVPALLIKLTPRWYSHLNQNGVLEDDQIFLHHQERYLETFGGSENYSKAFYLPTKADLYVSELRQWVNLYNSDPFPNTRLSSPLSKTKLLDRFTFHTQHCSSCRTALKNIQKLKTLAIIIIWLTWIVTPLIWLVLQPLPTWSVITFSTIVFIVGVTWWQLNKLERRFYVGNDIPPRNLS